MNPKQNPVTPRRRKRSDGLTRAGAAKVLRQMKASPAVLTQEQIQVIETRMQQDTDGVIRRMALAVIALSGAQLIEKVGKGDRESAQSVAQVMEHIGEYIGRAKALVEWLEAAQLRCMIALAYRDDGDELRAAVSREVKAS